MSPRLDESRPMAISVDERALTRILTAIVAFFAAAHLLSQAAVRWLGPERLLNKGGLMTLVDQFNLDGEMNLPTYYSCGLLALCGFLLVLVARRVRQTHAPMLWHWTILAWGFFTMSFDEFGGIHDRISVALASHAPGVAHGPLHYVWIVVGIPFVAVIGAFYIPFLLHLSGPFRRSMMLAGAVYVGGVLGMEMIGGWYSDRHGQNLFYMVLVAIEESMEMGGCILFARCLLRYLATDVDEVRLTFRRTTAAVSAPLFRERLSA